VASGGRPMTASSRSEAEFPPPPLCSSDQQTIGGPQAAHVFPPIGCFDRRSGSDVRNRSRGRRRTPWKNEWTALRDSVSIRALVPIGVSASVQSSPRSGQVEDRDDCSEDSEDEPSADHPCNPKCLPFRGEDHRWTSCDVEDSPGDHRERRNTHEDQHVSSFLAICGPFLRPNTHFAHRGSLVAEYLGTVRTS